MSLFDYQNSLSSHWPIQHKQVEVSELNIVHTKTSFKLFHDILVSRFGHYSLKIARRKIWSHDKLLCIFSKTSSIIPTNESGISSLVAIIPRWCTLARSLKQSWKKINKSSMKWMSFEINLDYKILLQFSMMKDFLKDLGFSSIMWTIFFVLFLYAPIFTAPIAIPYVVISEGKIFTGNDMFNSGAVLFFWIILLSLLSITIYKDSKLLQKNISIFLIWYFGFSLCLYVTILSVYLFYDMLRFPCPSWSSCESSSTTFELFVWCGFIAWSLLGVGVVRLMRYVSQKIDTKMML